MNQKTKIKILRNKLCGALVDESDLITNPRRSREELLDLILKASDLLGEIQKEADELMHVGYMHHDRPRRIKNGTLTGVSKGIVGSPRGTLNIRALEGPYEGNIEEIFNIPLYVKTKDI